jgi:hypothetical protein
VNWFNQSQQWLNHWPAALALACVACGSSGPTAIMQPTGDVRVTPWPSDALVGSDGKLHVTYPFPFDSSVADNLTALAVTLSQSDGFATTRSIFFPVTDDLVVDAGATASVVDLDDTSKTLSYPLLYRAETKQLVAMAPLGTALAEHHAYGCWVAAGVHDAKGRALHPSSTMSDAIFGHGAIGARAAYQKLARALDAAKVKPLAATAFTTQTLSGWAQKAQSDLTAMPARASFTRLFSTKAELDLLFGGLATTLRPGRPPTGGILHNNVAAVVEGTYDSPHYLTATPDTLGTFDDAMTVKATEKIPFILVLPVRGSYANTPLVIFQHGLNADRTAVIYVGNSFAARGYATLGIDELFHGSRLPGNVDKIYNILGTAGPNGEGDGIGDPTPAGAVQYFFDFAGDANAGVLPFDPRYMRDNFRQAAIDLMQEVRLARGGDFSDVIANVPMLPGLTLDGSKVVYSGESFGAILGAVVLGVDPLLEAAVLDVGGGGLLVDLVPNSPTFAQLLQPFVAGAFDQLVDVNHPDTLPARAQMSLNFLQEVIEPGDGLALAATADATKSVLFLNDWADELVPNQSNQALARAWGATSVSLAQRSRALDYVTLPTATAPLSASPLRAIVQFDPAVHQQFTYQAGQRKFAAPFPPFNRLGTPVDVDNPIEIAHTLALDFFDGVRAGAPVVSDPTR